MRGNAGVTRGGPPDGAQKGGPLRGLQNGLWKMGCGPGQRKEGKETEPQSARSWSSLAELGWMGDCEIQEGRGMFSWTGYGEGSKRGWVPGRAKLFLVPQKIFWGTKNVTSEPPLKKHSGKV